MEEKKLCIDKKKVPLYLKSIVSSQLEVNVLNVKYIGGGSFGFAYKVETDREPKTVVVKVFKLEGMHKKEAYQLGILQANSTIKFPKVYFLHDSTSEIPINCMGMEFIEGKDAFNSFGLLFKSKKAKLDFADKLTEGMHNIHCCTGEKFGDVENPIYDNWNDYYRTYAEDILKKAEDLHNTGKLEGFIFNTMKKAFEMYDVIFEEEVTTPALIHGDLNLMNVMVKKPFEIAAIIDPLNSMYADKEFDLFQLNNLTGPFFYLYKTYKKKYKTSENCDAKCAFYALWNETYCYIRSGALIRTIMYPIVYNMKKQMKLLSKKEI